MNRNRIVLEFKKNDEKEMEIYNSLMRYSNPAAIVKDILKGTIEREAVCGKKRA